jgi:type I restriction enzyme R subunit
MWLTGFDAPSCSTLYVDKPMRNHTLMQTITRANRVYPGKHSGVIVDYANVFASLERALAIYGTRGTTRSPVENKDELVDDLRAILEGLAAFCAAQGVNLDALEGAGTALERLNLVGLAVTALIAPDERRKEFLAQAQLARRVYTALKPHKRAAEFAPRMATVSALAEKIVADTGPQNADISAVLRRIGQVLDDSIEGSKISEGPPPIDLSRIDFKALSARFKGSATKNLDIERLKAAIRARLDRLIAANETRVDLRAKFEELIEAYNAGSAQLEQLFLELLKLSQSLTEEESRHVRENLAEDELVVFDLLTRPGPDLSAGERDDVKKVAKQLLAKLRAIFTIDWQKTAQSRARVRDAIEEALDAGLPRAYTPDVFKAKAGVVFQHVYERYGRAA